MDGMGLPQEESINVITNKNTKRNTIMKTLFTFALAGLFSNQQFFAANEKRRLDGTVKCKMQISKK